MTKYALDSNIVSYYLKGNQVIIEKIKDSIKNKIPLFIPPMVFLEIKRWLIALGAKVKMTAFEKLCLPFGIGVINRAILENAALIYAKCQKKGITLSDSDLLIAAYCITHDLTLVTNNIKHFKDISGLKLVNWIFADEQKE